MTRSSMESYERARASRDALSETRRSRALNREVIDGRGSIDSRTFNESHQTKTVDASGNVIVEAIKCFGLWESFHCLGYLTVRECTSK